MDTKALRQKILDLAIRGKLVPQDPNDEPASVLLERIRAQKQQMVREGKLKSKDIKDDTVIFVGEDNLHYEKLPDGSVKCIEDEIPFELPEGWAWCRVRDIAVVKGGKRLPKGASFSEEKTDHAYIRVTDMKNHSVNITDLRYISEDTFSAIKNYTISKDDLYVTIAGTIGVVGEVPALLDGMNLTENAVKITDIAINKSFLCVVLQTEFVQQQFQDKTHQVAMPKLALERILSTLIPICSREQQEKIVVKIQTCDGFLSSIDAEKDDLQKTVALTKSKILDLAIRGQLVPQDPNDEPASVLLERIRAEKEALIKAGKLKRDKKESVIFRGDDNSYYEKIGNTTENIDDEIPFEIPGNWHWCRIRDICTMAAGKSKPTEAIHEIPFMGSYPCFGGNGIRGYVDEYTHAGKHSIIGRQGALCGNVNVADGRFYATEHAVVTTLFSEIDFAWNNYMLTALKLNQYATGAAQPGLSVANIMNVFIPLPPYNEQIVLGKRIDQLFGLLKLIEKSLS